MKLINSSLTYIEMQALHFTSMHQFQQGFIVTLFYMVYMNSETSSMHECADYIVLYCIVLRTCDVVLCLVCRWGMYQDMLRRNSTFPQWTTIYVEEGHEEEAEVHSMRLVVPITSRCYHSHYPFYYLLLYTLLRPTCDLPSLITRGKHSLCPFSSFTTSYLLV